MKGGNLLMDYILTDGQEEVIDSIYRWFLSADSNRPYVSLTGSAGVGKTYSLKALIDKLNFTEKDYISCAYTGKAVINLIQSGLKASTIHSLIYTPVMTRKTFYDMDGNKKSKRTFEFVLKTELDPDIKLIIVDEATMVNDSMTAELLSFGIPIIFVGDMNQLPPVFGISSVMLNPDYRLTKIMRQKENDPIIILSQMVLNDIPLEYGKYGLSSVIPEIRMDKSLLSDYDQIITATNAARDTFNDFIRHDLYNRGKRPVLSDKVMCRQNNWDCQVEGIYLTNGLIGYITDIDRSRSHNGYWIISFQPTFMEREFEGLQLDLKYITSNAAERKNFGFIKNEKFEYAYAVTCHAMQGSSDNRVLYADQRMRDPYYTKKLRYTAITRARESITIVLGDEHSDY